LFIYLVTYLFTERGAKFFFVEPDEVSLGAEEQVKLLRIFV